MMRFILLAAAFFSAQAHAQRIRIVAYNVENLFDVYDDPRTQDEDFTPNGKLQWTPERLQEKYRRLAEVWDSLSPDIAGLTEIENRNVLEGFAKYYKKRKYSAVKRKYSVVLFEGNDERGIDPALIFDAKKFRFLSARSLKVNLSGMPDSSTRDILVAALETPKPFKDTLHLAVNHWPSRRNPPIARFRAGETLRKWVDSLTTVRPGAKIILMGDFNDEPIDSSIVYGLGETGRVNLWKPIHARGEGSYYHNKKWTAIDQIIVSQALYSAPNRWTYDKAEIYKRDFLLEKNPKFYPAPFRTYAGDKYLGGYSDHLPIYMDLKAK
jgi:predicted extracellular nuclease